MTAKEFIAKWQASTLKERSASQSHFNDLCALIGHPNPVVRVWEGLKYLAQKIKAEIEAMILGTKKVDDLGVTS